jgi:response regulator RpfG family c-di-GMP phosphodiesterase
MPSWTLWVVLGVASWLAVISAVLVVLGRLSKAESLVGEAEIRAHFERETELEPEIERPLSILVVDDDERLRDLLRTSFELAHLRVDEADSAFTASARIEERHPDVLVLDVSMPVVDGLSFCFSLKHDPATDSIPVVLLTGDEFSAEAIRESGADAHLRKPFSPLALLSVVEKLGMRAALDRPVPVADGEQLLLYAQDFRRLVELERGQRALLQDAYRETVVALARALESKDGLTGAHSERVRRYATKLAVAVDSSMLEEPGLEYGFILHDVGKIGIPDFILRKREPLTIPERRLLETHTVLGEQMIGDAALLRGEGARVVRSHHERWNGSGYPDGLRRAEIPLGARVFAVADALDAMTSDRPYRAARGWDDAVAEILASSGSQFDPDVVSAFREHEPDLRAVHDTMKPNYAFNPN